MTVTVGIVRTPMEMTWVTVFMIMRVKTMREMKATITEETNKTKFMMILMNTLVKGK